MLNKLFPFELNCFALILLQGLQRLFSLKMSSALVVVWVKRLERRLRVAGMPPLGPSPSHCPTVVSDDLPLLRWGALHFFSLCFAFSAPFSFILLHALTLLSNTQTLAVRWSPCAPWKPGCGLEARWALWEWAWDRMGHATLPLEWVSASWEMVEPELTEIFNR